MKSTKEYWKVRSIVGDETDAVVLLEELEFEYCLPNGSGHLGSGLSIIMRSVG